jgi:hypothetical protein
MDYDYTKRGYLLPEGCKDLIDAMKLEGWLGPTHQSAPPPATLPPVVGELMAPATLPPVIGELMVPELPTVAELAALLKVKPFQIIADLMQLGAFVTVKHQLDFVIISKVVRKYGLIAKRAT